MTDEQKMTLYEQQKKLLDTFLGTGAISQVQYKTSLGGLRQKMGIDKMEEVHHADKTEP